MKKIVAVLLVLLSFGYSVKAQEPASVVPNVDPNAPILKFETDVLDYGTVKFGEHGIREFKIKNVGKSDLKITNVQGQCGCTTTSIDGKPGWPQEPISPGKSAVIRVKYDTKRDGPFEKGVTVTSNAKEPEMYVRIKGFVERPEGEMQIAPPPAPVTTSTVELK